MMLICGRITAAGAAQESWRICLRGTDQTDIAAPRDGGGVLLLNLTALSPSLMLGIQIQREEILIRDASGAEWRGRNGESFLAAPGRRLLLKYPLLLEGTTIYLPIETISELAGLSLTLDPSSREANLGPPGNKIETLAGDWETFTLEKTPEEKDQYGRIHRDSGRARPNTAANLQHPPAYDSLRLRLGQGYVQGADWGTDLTGSGKIRGVQTNFGTQLTTGKKGLEVLTGRISLLDSEMGWGVEAGDLFSDLWGLTRGLRYSWEGRKKHRPSLSLYLKTARGGNEKTVLGYRDEFALSKAVAVGGELASDGSLMLKARYRKDRIGLNAYYRRSSSEATGDGKGLFASYSLWRGITVQGGLTHSATGVNKAERRDWRLLSLRIPIIRSVALTLEHTTTDSQSQKNDANAAAVSFSVGPVRVFYRYQFRDSEWFAAGSRVGWIGSSQRESLASAS